MGKTIRIDPESGERTGRKSNRRMKTAPETIGVPEFARGGKRKEPEVITEEWAVKSVAKHIGYELERLIANEIMLVSEKELYTSYIEDYVRRAVPKYNPKQKNKDGRTSSASHYFSSCVDLIVCNIVRYLTQKKRKADVVPLADAPAEEAHREGAVSTGELSDCCRSVKELEFRMDVETMRMMLDATERKVLDLRLDGYTYEEVGQAIGCSKTVVIRRYMPRIQKISRLCGFVPQSEIRASFHAGKEETEYSEKSPHQIPSNG